MRAECATYGCESMSADGDIHCSECKPWVETFGLRGERISRAVNA